IRGSQGLELAAFATAEGREDLTPVPLNASAEVCAEIIRHVDRLGEPLILSDAGQDRRFSSSEYVRRHHVRSVACLPVTHAEVRHGIVYLDNALVAGAFTPRHSLVLEALATQAGIALENAELFARSLRAERTLRASEERLRQSQKMDALGRLAGGVAHDFNNMLTGILAAAELLGFRLAELKVEDPDDNIRIIVQSAQRAAELTRQLLVFSRQRPPAKTQLDLNRVIGEARALLARSIDPRIVIECELLATDPLVLGDRALLQSAVLNLGINARDAMPQGGKLRIATRNVVLGADVCAQSAFALKPGPHVELVVQDDGTGMDPATEARIFEPFFTTKGVGRGTGLGLAAVHGTLVDHGGAIQVESSPGRGTTFTLWLPQAVAAPLAVDADTRPRPIEGRLTILLVDDEPAVQDTIRRVLESLNASVLTASDGREGVAVFSARHAEIDLVLLDSLMPGLSGADVFYRLRAIDSSVPVLMASGFAADAPLEDLQRTGLAGFIMKPFTRSALMAAVEKALAHGGRRARAH
ncbi:MAG TPA: ATP-binding protein, partial [Polyangiaceae bacterium]|nr:ATP-binding protein [Polyangiaceae bacterium]